jgi:NAD(P)-dependent dehydrogenase (short-subunit alcohol dehydrogenase family)
LHGRLLAQAASAKSSPNKIAPGGGVLEKVALVTGAAQGIGRAIALLLAARGYRVAVADVKLAKDELPFWKCDVSKERAVRACIGGVVKRFGRLDALVNNAGLANPHTGPVEKLELAEWNRRIGVNLTGPFLVAKHATAHLRRTRGAIVNIASTRALQSEPDT